jgi:hypothetical protein
VENWQLPSMNQPGRERPASPQSTLRTARDPSAGRLHLSTSPAPALGFRAHGSAERHSAASGDGSPEGRIPERPGRSGGEDPTAARKEHRTLD